MSNGTHDCLATIGKAASISQNKLRTYLLIVLNLFNVVLVKVEEAALHCLVDAVEHITNREDERAYARRRIVEWWKRGVDVFEGLVGFGRSASEVDHRVCRDERGRVGPLARIWPRVQINLFACDKK